MADGRVTQVSVETLTQPAASARVTQVAVEALTASVPAARVTQCIVELLTMNVVTQDVTTATITSGSGLGPPALVPGPVPTTGATITSTTVLSPPSVAVGNDVRLTSAYVEALTQATTAAVRLTIAYAEALMSLALSIVTGPLTNTATLFPPTVAPGAVTIDASHIGPATGLFPPTVEPEVPVVRLTSAYAEAITQNAAADVHVTNVVAEALTQNATDEVRLTSLIVEVLREPSLPEMVFNPDEAPVGLTWVEFTDSENQRHVWSNIALPDPETYYGGFKEHRVIEFGSIRRGLSDINGVHESVAWTWIVIG